jgi:hypothetical protein
MAIDQLTSSLVKNQFPDFYKEDSPGFLLFVKAYYEYMEQSGKSIHELNKLKSYKDIDDTLDEYIEYFRRTIIPSLPISVVSDKRLLAKTIRDFYQSKGTLDSYKFLFRILYDEDVEVSYPADQILKVSDGDWQIDRYIIIPSNESAYKFIGKTILGIESRAEAFVEDVVRRYLGGRDMMQITLSKLKGNFSDGEPIKIKSEASGVGFEPIIEAGINTITVEGQGSEYAPGDIVELISAKTGKEGKGVVTKVITQAGIINYTLVDGGSGYTATTGSPGTIITQAGGDGTANASFVIGTSDITDTFAISRNTNLFISNTVFGNTAAIISYSPISDPTAARPSDATSKSSTFANTVISSPSYGFPELDEVVANKSDFRTNKDAVIKIANTRAFNCVVGIPLYGVTSGANATITSVQSNTAGALLLRVDTYKNFTGTESIKVGKSTGNTIGTLVSGKFYANTIGYHILEVGNVASQTIVAGDELVGAVSGAFGIVKKVIATVANGYSQAVGGADDRHLVKLQVTANTSANLTSQWDAGPMRSFLELEAVRKVGSATVVGNVAYTTSNTQIENIYTRLDHSLIFKTAAFGTIDDLSLRIGGSGYSVAPTVLVNDSQIASLGIRDVFLYLQNTASNWTTANTQITAFDTNDRLEQSSSGAKGDIKQISPAIPKQFLPYGTGLTTITHANTTVETIVRVFQDETQATSNINYKLGTVATKHYSSADQSTLSATGSAKIVKIIDNGILGQNAIITAKVGANGAISGIRSLDSGYAYGDKELVTFSTSARTNATSGTGLLTLKNAANAEGYYASNRSQVSTKRGFIQDGYKYQEFSYELSSGIAFDRYKDLVDNLVHPAGQKLFGQFVSRTPLNLNVSSISHNRIRKKTAGTVAISNNSLTITGTSTSLTTNFSNNDIIVIQTAPGTFYQTTLNKVNSNTSANLINSWTNGAVSGANAHYYTGTVS